MPPAAKLDAHDTQLLVVDLQVKLLPLIHGNEDVVAACTRLIRVADIFGMPVTVTEQYPQGMGPTHARVTGALASVKHSKFEKTSFSCCGDKAVIDHLASVARKQVLVCGIESHVCVQQTVLDLVNFGWEPFVPADAVSSRLEFDYDISLLRMQQAGAVVTTTESVMFELTAQAGTDRFKRILDLVKESM
jgi:nicotinamidase-related amidase